MARTNRNDARGRGRRRRPAARELVDEVMDRYTDWREACSVVELAYRGWRSATAEESALAHAGYVAALEREASAAGAYAELIERARRPHPGLSPLAANGA